MEDTISLIGPSNALKPTQGGDFCLSGAFMVFMGRWAGAAQLGRCISALSCQKSVQEVLG